MKRTIALLLTLSALSAGTLAIAGDSKDTSACPTLCSPCSQASCPISGCGGCN